MIPGVTRSGAWRWEHFPREVEYYAHSEAVTGAERALRSGRPPLRDLLVLPYTTLRVSI